MRKTERSEAKNLSFIVEHLNTKFIGVSSFIVGQGADKESPFRMDLPLKVLWFWPFYQNDRLHLCPSHTVLLLQPYKHKWEMLHHKWAQERLLWEQQGVQQRIPIPAFADSSVMLCTGYSQSTATALEKQSPPGWVICVSRDCGFIYQPAKIKISILWRMLKIVVRCS